MPANGRRDLIQRLKVIIHFNITLPSLQPLLPRTFPMKFLFLISLLLVTSSGRLLFDQCHFLPCRNWKLRLKATAPTPPTPTTWHIEWGWTSHDVTRVLFSCLTRLQQGIVVASYKLRYVEKNLTPAQHSGHHPECVLQPTTISDEMRTAEISCAVLCFVSGIANLTAVNTANWIYIVNVVSCKLTWFILLL